MFPWILCCILLIVVFFLITKIIFIEKSIDEIHTEFQERLSSDTNTLIDISSRDPHLRKLASEINIQLRLLRKERHRYHQGDLELKEAITNISHDLRTPLTAINGYLDLLEREEKSIPKFTSKFTSMINIPVFTNDELVNFAKVYTRENGYMIDQMGMLALYNLISTSQKEDQPMNIGAGKDMIDNAIMKSKGGIRKLISKKKVNQDGYKVLYEKDFN